jgi:hypothetical protein
MLCILFYTAHYSIPGHGDARFSRMVLVLHFLTHRPVLIFSDKVSFGARLWLSTGQF